MPSGPTIRPVDVDPRALLRLHAADPHRYPALLASAAVGRPLGRFDILFAHPRERLTLHADGRLTYRDRACKGASFLRELDAWLERESDERVSGAPPFSGGWLLFLGYELAGEIEPRLRLPTSSGGPIAQAVRIPAAVVYDHESGRSWIAAERGGANLEEIEADLRSAAPLEAISGALLEDGVDEEDPARFLGAVERALEYIAAGDVYQANLSREWRARLREGVKPAHLYERLRAANPGPFSGVARFDQLAVISSSPERLVEVRGRAISTRPIAGTRPRGGDPDSDRALAKELHAHPKERAEHVMLIDLERNDLGRVCTAGSVRVDEFMTIESYAHVHHIVSNVRGELRPQVTAGAALAAVFPGGTITGCPKVRCMELIAELEGRARGAYTGSFGYLTLNGEMDMNILIRSIAVCGGELSLRAGAGIVADSVPESELAETRAKARGVLKALGAEATS